MLAHCEPHSHLFLREQERESAHAQTGHNVILRAAGCSCEKLKSEEAAIDGIVLRNALTYKNQTYRSSNRQGTTEIMLIFVGSFNDLVTPLHT